MAEERFLTETKHQRFRPYSKYKDSGVEWLGEIPAYWEVKRIKNVARIHTGGTPAGLLDEAFEEEGIPWVKPDQLQGDCGIVAPDRRLSYNAAKSLGIVIAGSSLVCGIGTVGKTGHALVDVCTNQQINAITFGPKVINRYGQFMTVCLEQEFARRANKVTIAICNKSEMGEVPVCIPQTEEQRSIASFLDRETAKIDALVAKRERLIELLQEKRTALITQAVTKGLDPNVPMKYSGVEWLGDVPIAWNLLRLKHIVQFLGGGTPSKDNLEYWQGDIPWVSPKDMKSWIVSDTVDKITEEAVAGSATKVVGPDTVLIVVRSGILNHTIPVALSGSEVALNQDLKALKAQAAVVPEYLAYFIAGMQSPLLFAWRKEGATVESLELDLIANTLIPLPSVSQQRIIVNYLKRETAKIDALVKKVQEAVQRLKEYRTALISAAVTGKIDVRDEVRR